MNRPSHKVEFSGQGITSDNRAERLEILHKKKGRHIDIYTDLRTCHEWHRNITEKYWLIEVLVKKLQVGNFLVSVQSNRKSPEQTFLF